MNPDIGLDVSKGESQIQAFLDKGEPYGKSFKIQQTQEGFVQLLKFLKSILKLFQVFNQWLY